MTSASLSHPIYQATFPEMRLSRDTDREITTTKRGRLGPRRGAAEVAIASILAPGLWALQSRSWRRPELHMKTARIKSTNRASRIGGTTRQEHRAGE